MNFKQDNQLRKTVISMALAMSVLSIGPAQAGPIWEFAQAGQSFSNANWNFANNFQVINTVTVTGLGYYADPVTGNADANQVALFNSSGVLLGQATVDNTYALLGHFRFATVAAITLAPGEYQVVGVSQGGNYTWNDVGFYTDPDITYLGNSWRPSTHNTAEFLDFSDNDVADGFWGANVFIGAPTFTESNVPEPGSMALLGLGLAGIAVARRRQSV